LNSSWNVAAIVKKNVIIVVVVTVVALEAVFDIVSCKSEYKEILSVVNLNVKRCRIFHVFM